MTEEWRTLRTYGEEAIAEELGIKPAEFGEKTQAIRDNWAEIQGARRRALEKDFDLMAAYQQTSTSWFVVNFRTMKQYEVDTETLQCSCPRGYYDFADEGSNVLCKHLLYTAICIGEEGGGDVGEDDNAERP